MSGFEVVDANLRRAMRFFGYATGTGEIIEQGGMLIISSGLNYGVFNLVLLTERCADLEARIAEAATHFQARRRRWSFWVCEDLLERTARRRARQIFQDSGFRALSHPPGMIASELSIPVRPLPELCIQPVAGKESRRDFLSVASICFDVPARVARAVYEPDTAWNGAYRGFVGYLNGIPVSTVAIVEEAGALGVYSLATLPEYRRQGFGEALLRKALAEVRATTGVDPTVLQSTDAGFSLYRRMGYREVTRYAVYLSG